MMIDLHSFRIRDARQTICGHIRYYDSRGAVATFDALQALTGLPDSVLELVLRDLQDSREACRVTVNGITGYKPAFVDRRVRSWELEGRYHPNQILAIDVETTGLNRSEDDVLQFAAVEYDGDCRINRFFGSSLPAWPEAEQINNITPDMVNGLPRLCECPDTITDAIEDARVLMGYNLMFDQNFIRAAGVKLPAGAICCDVMHDVRDMLRNMSLERACKVFEVPAAPSHDACNDCQNTIALSKAVARVIA